MKIKKSFLNEVLVEIYMDQLEGFVHKEIKNLVCRSKKTLDMLKQSPRAWYHCIKSFFINEGFYKSQADHSLYVQQTGEYLLVAIF